MTEKMMKASDVGAEIYYLLRADYLQKIPYGNEYAGTVTQDPIMIMKYGIVRVTDLSRRRRRSERWTAHPVEWSAVFVYYYSEFDEHSGNRCRKRNK